MLSASAAQSTGRGLMTWAFSQVFGPTAHSQIRLDAESRYA